jgi:hypothetical protein
MRRLAGYRVAARGRFGPAGYGITGVANPITATVLPSLVAVDWTQTPADALVAGSYASTAGTIVSAVPTYLVDGVSRPGSFDLLGGETLSVTVLVTDSAGSARVFSAGSITVTMPPPPAAFTVGQWSIAPA